MKRFSGGEGIWFDSGHVYFSTKGTNQVWDLDVAAGRLSVLYDGDAPLKGVDNLTVTRAGELYVCEDGGDMEICLITPAGVVAPFLQLTGPAAQGPPSRGNELAGVAFNPAGDRMYFSAQRAFDFGVTYEVRGPFGGAGAPPPAPAFRRPSASKPPLTVRAPHRVSLAQLRRGVRIEVGTESAGRAIAALRTSQLGRVPGQRGSTFRPRNVTLARTSRRVARRDDAAAPEGVAPDARAPAPPALHRDPPDRARPGRRRPGTRPYAPDSGASASTPTRDRPDHRIVRFGTEE